MTEICTFFTFTHFRQTFYACNFFDVFLQFFRRILDQREILGFFIFFKEEFFWSYKHFLKTLKPNAQKNRLKKSKKLLILLIYMLRAYLGSWCEMTFWRAMSQSMVCLGTRSVRLLAIQWNSIRPFRSSTFAASSLQKQANNSHWSISLAL